MKKAKLKQIITELKAFEMTLDNVGFEHAANLIGEAVEQVEEVQECLVALETGKEVYA